MSEKSIDIQTRRNAFKKLLKKAACCKINMLYFLSLDFARLERELTLQEKIDYISYKFFQHLKYNLNIFTPETFSEKIQWLKIFYENPLLTTCADKYRVREYAAEKIGADTLIPLTGVYDSPDEIDFDTLPERFALKVNWGSGQNIICRDKKTFNMQEAKNKLRKWLQKESNHYYHSFEVSYKNIVPKIICEQYIEQLDGKLLDYKFFCFNGKVEYIQVDFDRHTNHTRSLYSRKWEKMNFILKFAQQIEFIPRPECFEKMVEFAERLAQDFLFVRVDLYNISTKIYFGEMTFYPGSGMEAFFPQEWDGKFGELLILPR